jgi:hypothetical protein
MDETPLVRDSACSEFIGEKCGGPGVRLSKAIPGPVAVEDPNASNDE